MSLEGGASYIYDKSNSMWEIQTANPNVLTNAAIIKLIQGMEGHDPALWPVYKAFVADADQEPDIGLRLRASTYIPKINEVLTKMRQDGINMDWATIQLRIASMANEKGAKGRVAQTEAEYEWSIIGNTFPSRIRRGLRLHKDIFNKSVDFRQVASKVG